MSLKIELGTMTSGGATSGLVYNNNLYVKSITTTFMLDAKVVRCTPHIRYNNILLKSMHASFLKMMNNFFWYKTHSKPNREK